MKIILASSSPRRRELLGALGLSFTIDVPDVDERLLPGEDPRTHVLRLAAEKARKVAGRHGGGLVIAADTVVVLDDRIIGKPEDEAEARRILERLAGKTHRVYTGVAVADAAGGSVESKVACSRVTMSAMGKGEIAGYVATGEPLDKAGAYAVQGLGGRFVSRVSGSLSNVIGLPLEELAELLEEAGCRVTLPADVRREKS
jgi:septum formation protein